MATDVGVWTLSLSGTAGATGCRDSHMYHTLDCFQRNTSLSYSILLVHCDDVALLVQRQTEVDIQIAGILLHLLALHGALQNVAAAAPHLVTEIEHGLLPVRFAIIRRGAERHLLSGEEDVEIADQRIHVVGVLAIQLKVTREVEVLLLHCVNVQILQINTQARNDEDAAGIGDGLCVGNHVHQRLEQRDLLDRVHLEAVHVVPD